MSNYSFKQKRSFARNRMANRELKKTFWPGMISLAILMVMGLVIALTWEFILGILGGLFIVLVIGIIIMVMVAVFSWFFGLK